MVYDNMPDFCFLCKHFGHLDAKCFSCSHSAPPPAAPGTGDLNHRPTPVPAKDKGQGKEVVTAPRMRWTHVKKNQRRQDSTSEMISHSTPHTVTTIVHISPVTTVTTSQSAANHIAILVFTLLRLLLVILLRTLLALYHQIILQLLPLGLILRVLLLLHQLTG